MLRPSQRGACRPSSAAVPTCALTATVKSTLVRPGMPVAPRRRCRRSTMVLGRLSACTRAKSTSEALFLCVAGWCA